VAHPIHPILTDRSAPTPAAGIGLFFSQVEYCDNLIFHRRNRPDELGGGCWTPTADWPADQDHGDLRPQITKRNRGQLQTVIQDLDLPNRSSAATTAMGSSSSTSAITSCSATERPPQCARHARAQSIDNPPAPAEAASISTLLDIQQDILEPSIDRGQLDTSPSPRSSRTVNAITAETDHPASWP